MDYQRTPVPLEAAAVRTEAEVTKSEDHLEVEVDRKQVSAGQDKELVAVDRLQAVETTRQCRMSAD